VLTLPVGPQRFQPIAGRHPQIVEHASLIEQAQLPQRRPLNVRRQPAAAQSRPDQFGLRIGKTDDHDCNVKRYGRQCRALAFVPVRP